MNHRSSCRRVGALLLVLWSAGAAGQFRSVDKSERASLSADPPNVLLLVADDMMFDSLGVQDPFMVTPNLDRLAAQGVRFTRYAANHPVCAPSRATLMTGLYNTVHGVWINGPFMNPPNTTYLAEVFARAGYATGLVGKWHLDGGADPALGVDQIIFRPREKSYVWPSRRRGFQDWLGYECCQDHDVPFFWDEGVDPPAFTLAPEFGWEAKFQRAAMRDFVERNAATGKPWMYEVAFGLPHVPNEAPPEFLALYDPATIPLPPWLEPDLTPTQQQFARDLLRVVYAMISFLDFEIGEMLADLDELGEAENTIVAFTSDNGDLLGSHWDVLAHDPVLFRYKDTPFQNSFRLPMILRWPRAIPPNLEVDTLTSTIDFPPTLLSLAGLPAPWRMQGDDMSQWALGGQGPVHPAVWLHLRRLFFGSFWAIWTGDHILSQGDYRYLFDLRNDPYETTNLEGVPELSALQSELSSLLASYTAEASSPPTLPDLCGARDDAEGQLDGAFSRIAQATVVDGLSIRAQFELMLAVGCGDSDNPEARRALLSAFGRNMEAFDRTDFVGARRYRALITLALSGSSAMSDHLRAVLSDRRNVTLNASYAQVTCDETGTCFPENPFLPAARSEQTARGTIEPFSGAGDLDGDGLSNATEFQNAQIAKSGVDGFVLAALDPARDGTEAPSSGGGGACFIATAAYGTPLAAQLDLLRRIRDDELLKRSAGAAFTDAYYHLSPKAAAWLASREHVKTAVREILDIILFAHAHAASVLGTSFFAGAWVLVHRNAATHRRLRRRFGSR